MPLLVRGRARFAQTGMEADRLHAVPLTEFPFQIVTRDELAEARMEGHDVVVLEVHLDEGLPVVVALVHLNVVEHVAGEIEIARHAQAGEVFAHVALALEQQPVPVLQRRARQVRARLLLEVRRAQQVAFQVIRPAVQRAHDVLGIAAPIEHDGLPMPAHVGKQFDAVRIAHQHAAFGLGGKRVIADFRDHQLMADVTRAMLEQTFDFSLIQRLVEVCRDGQLGFRRHQVQCGAEIGHYPHSQ